MADWFLDARVREGRGDRPALRGDFGVRTYADVQRDANRFAHLLREAGVQPEQRVILALPDGPEWVAAFFGILKLGSVVVMVNPDLPADGMEYFLEYTRASGAVVSGAGAEAFAATAAGTRHLRATVVVDDAFPKRLAAAPATFDNFPSHRDDAAIWLFSGGTTGRPKAVVQTHRSFANTTELYAKGALGYGEGDVTLSVPKLFFGYATGSNLLFPFSVGGCSVLFPGRCTPDEIFRLVAEHRPTILINVPTMIQKLLQHPGAADADLSCLRLSTSAGEALPAELHQRWNDAFGVDLLDGLGTAEMWHVFLTNTPGDVHPGTLGRPVPGFDVRVRDDDGNDLPDGEAGWLWVRGDSRAIGYWQQMEKTRQAFRGDWCVSGDMLCRNADGTFTYCGRGDDMLKVSGKWLAPAEVENCLLGHADVKEAVVIGACNADGLVKPHAFVLSEGAAPSFAEDLRAWATERLEPYKVPRGITVVESLPRTHLGKVDRGALRRAVESGAEIPQSTG
jgi:benzoate-CoA ligase family protein